MTRQRCFGLEPLAYNDSVESGSGVSMSVYCACSHEVLYLWLWYINSVFIAILTFVYNVGHLR